MSLLLWDQNNTAAIVLASSADGTEHFAARELAAYFQKMSGKTFAVCEQADDRSASILVGRGACEAAGFKLDEDLTDDGFMIVSQENRLFITGLHSRGTLYGVYEFLEEVLGCRFFSPETEVIPKTSEMKIEAICIKRVPPIEYRSSSVCQLRDPVYAATASRPKGVASTML